MTFKQRLEKEFEYIEMLQAKKIIKKKEKAAFSFPDETILGEEAGLIREYSILSNKLAFGNYFKVPHISLEKLEELLKDLGNAIEDDKYSNDKLKKIIVILDVLLDVQISYYCSALEMLKKFSVEEIVANTKICNFEKLFNFLYSKEMHNEINK